MPQPYDLIIIGGGIIGSMAARYLSRYQLSILLIDRETDICMGTTSGNSAFVHAGYDPVPGSLKAITNVEGNALYEQLSVELGFDFERNGDYVVAIGQEEVPALERLMEQGKKNGVPGLAMITGEELLSREPLINPDAVLAMWAPSGGTCDPFGANIAACENAIQNGVQVMLETEFLDFIWEGTRITGIRTNRGDFGSRWVINVAGLFADDVMHKAGVRPEFKIQPRRGEYYVLDEAEIKLKPCFFPTPSAAGKGILAAGTVHGNVIIGPNAEVIQDKEDRAVTAAGLQEIICGAKKLVPSLTLRPVISLFAGLARLRQRPLRNPGRGLWARFHHRDPNACAGIGQPGRDRIAGADRRACHRPAGHRPAEGRG